MIGAMTMRTTCGATATATSADPKAGAKLRREKSHGRRRGVTTPVGPRMVRCTDSGTWSGRKKMAMHDPWRTASKRTAVVRWTHKRKTTRAAARAAHLREDDQDKYRELLDGPEGRSGTVRRLAGFFTDSSATNRPGRRSVAGERRREPNLMRGVRIGLPAKRPRWVTIPAGNQPDR